MSGSCQLTEVDEVLSGDARRHFRLQLTQLEGLPGLWKKERQENDHSRRGELEEQGSSWCSL